MTYCYRAYELLWNLSWEAIPPNRELQLVEVRCGHQLGLASYQSNAPHFIGGYEPAWRSRVSAQRRTPSASRRAGSKAAYAASPSLAESSDVFANSHVA